MKTPCSRVLVLNVLTECKKQTTETERGREKQGMKESRTESLGLQCMLNREEQEVRRNVGRRCKEGHRCHGK